MVKYTTLNFLSKYYRNNSNFIKSLKNNEIYHASLDQLNDPFESIITFKEIKNKNVLYVDHPIKKSRIIRVGEKENKEFSQIKNELKSYYKKNIGIACFTMNPLNQLMWSHYAGNHTGVCLVFNSLKDWSYFRNVNQVNYNTEEIEVEYLTEFDPEGQLELLKKFVFNKSIEWKYEQEMRRMLPYYGSYKFKVEALSMIIFGSRMKATEKEKIIKIAKIKYPNVGFFEIGIDENDKKLKIFDFYSHEELEFKISADFNTMTNLNGEYICIAKEGLECGCPECSGN